MDINRILAAIGGMLGAFNAPTAFGQAFLRFVEFWLIGLQAIVDIFAKLFSGFAA